MVYCSQFVVLADCVDNVVFHVTIIIIQLIESLLPVVARRWFYVDLGGISLLPFVKKMFLKNLKNLLFVDGGTGKVKEAWGAETSQLKVHKKRRKGSKKRFIEEKMEQTNAATWSVSSTSQWQYPDKRVIQNAVELMQLDTFVSCKVCTILEHSNVTVRCVIYFGNFL